MKFLACSIAGLSLLSGCQTGLEPTGSQVDDSSDVDDTAEIRVGNFPGPDGPIRAAYVLRDGVAVVGGDILWPANSALSLGAAAGPFKRWPGGVIPYENRSNNSVFLEGVEAWNAVSSQTGVTLVPRTNQTDYLNVVAKQGCYSYMGTKGGAQELSLGTGCYKAQAIHEIGHAIGLMHEHTRADRDNYVRINWDNVIGGRDSQFGRVNLGITQGATNYTNYDYTSIMHYRTKITDPRFVIDPTIPLYKIVGGGPSSVDNYKLSSSDIAGVRAMYEGFGGLTPEAEEESCTVAECGPYNMDEGDCETLSTGDYKCEESCLVKVSSCPSNGSGDNGTPPGDYLLCDDGEEYLAVYHCDGIQDCFDNSDEDNCGTSGGTSPYGSCSYNGQTGDCIDTTTTTCFGQLYSGLCPGGNEILCCF